MLRAIHSSKSNQSIADVYLYEFDFHASDIWRVDSETKPKTKWKTNEIFRSNKIKFCFLWANKNALERCVMSFDFGWRKQL